MKFNELKVGSKFLVVREHSKVSYLKISYEPKRNTQYGQKIITIHSSTIVEEIK